MKRIVILGLFALLLSIVGCSSSASQKSDLAMQDFIKAYQDQGVEVDPNEKQMFAAVNAVDGVIFYMNNSPVKIYEYSDVKAMKKAQSENNLLKDWIVNDRFLLETKKADAIDIFNSVK